MAGPALPEIDTDPTRTRQYNALRCELITSYKGTRSFVPAGCNLRAIEPVPSRLRSWLQWGIKAMRKAVLLSVLFLGSGWMARASMRAADFLSWISDHLQTVSYTVTTPRATYAEFASAKMEFDGCDVKIDEDLKTEKSDIQTTVSFNLSYLQPDMIRSTRETGYGSAQVTPYFVVLLPLAGTAKNTTTFIAPDGSTSDTASSTSVSLSFQDRDLASRQADAWRDAAFACGARKSISAR